MKDIIRSKESNISIYHSLDKKFFFVRLIRNPKFEKTNQSLFSSQYFVNIFGITAVFPSLHNRRKKIFSQSFQK